MLEIKKCRQIKNEVTKANADNRKVILNLSQYPFCSVIISHGDGKSWGYFFEGKTRYFLGRANQIMTMVITSWGGRNALNSDVEVIHNSPEVRRVYTGLIKHIFDRYTWYGMQEYLQGSLLMNPVLFTNLVDCNVFLGRYEWSGKYDNVASINWYFESDEFDYTKPLIKDAFKLPIPWIKTLYNRYFSVKQILEFKKYNYNPEELIGYGWAIDNVPSFLIPHRELTIKYCQEWCYRDYINMRCQLPEEAQVHFPINPQDVAKYHDRIYVVFERMRDQIREKQLEEQQKKYEDSVYKDASKYDYSDKKYSIIACKKLSDLGFEGNVLNHCVGSYVNSVCKGNEYILFLRKNSDIETPYFTIDLTPDKHVRQIHGKCNCNMSDEIRPFVEAWAKKFELDLKGCSGVLCALG